MCVFRTVLTIYNNLFPLNSINRFVFEFLMETACVWCEIGTAFLNRTRIIQIKFCFKGLGRTRHAMTPPTALTAASQSVLPLNTTVHSVKQTSRV
jgi:hypothetical protein